jgi:hypothetical protein
MRAISIAKPSALLAKPMASYPSDLRQGHEQRIFL